MVLSKVIVCALENAKAPNNNRPPTSFFISYFVLKIIRQNYKLILKKRLKFHFSLSLLYQSRIIPTIKPSKHLKIHYFVVFLQVINKT